MSANPLIILAAILVVAAIYHTRTVSREIERAKRERDAALSTSRSARALRAAAEHLVEVASAIGNLIGRGVPVPEHLNNDMTEAMQALARVLDDARETPR